MSKKRVVHFFFLLLAFFLLSNAFPGIAGEMKAESRVIERFQQSYDSTIDFTAAFRQETDFKTLNRKLVARGKLYFKQPGKMLWSYEEPKGQVVLADGKALYFYQPEQGQIMKSPLKDAFQSGISLSFLLGIGNLTRDFKVTLKGLKKGNYILQLGPRGEWKGIRDIVLGVNCQSFDIIWAQIQDLVGNVVTIHFSDIRKGVGLKDSLFQLEVPDGVDVVTLGP
ncbi:MAG: outer membrane lipoprotein carrier protein LolA [Candidatus Binatia bacterium]